VEELSYICLLLNLVTSVITTLETSFYEIAVTLEEYASCKLLFIKPKLFVRLFHTNFVMMAY